MLSASVIEGLLRAEDIEGLLALGVPTDEYSHEARKIQVALANGSEKLDETSVIAAVKRVWVDSFGPFTDEDLQIRIPAFQRVAWNILQEFEE